MMCLILTSITYKRAYMATSGNGYFIGIIDHLNEYYIRHIQRLSSKKLKGAILRVMEE